MLSRRSVAPAGLVLALAALASCRQDPLARLPGARPPGMEVIAAAMIPPNTPLPALRGTKFGGVSSLVYDRTHDELLGLSDDSENARVFRMKRMEEPFRVVPTDVVLLEQAAGAPRKLDPEGLALLPSGNLLVSSEGFGDVEPHNPPAIVEYRHDGTFVRQLAVPQEFIQPPRGAVTHGVPHNQGFEALTLTPDARALWTGVETALVQDGPAPTAEHGSRSRLLEYRLEGGNFAPSREFAYDVDPLPATAFRSIRFAVSGLVELLALSDRDFLSLERAYVEDMETGAIVNRLRIFRVTIDGTPIPVGQDSIAGRADITPVTKRLLLDLGASPNLPRALAGLDNFEGIALIPSAEKGRATAILVSDDNFDARQRTWFVKVDFDLPPIP